MSGPESTRGPFVPTGAVVHELVGAAVQAPSADNRHHFFVTVQDRGLTLHADDAFIDARVPHRRLLTLVAYGAAAENMRLCLTRHGYTFAFEWFPDDQDRTVILRLRWDDVVPVAGPDPLAAHIESRHTNRKFFKGPPLSAADVATLEAAVPAGGGVALQWFDRRAPRGTMLRLMRIAETARFSTRFLHQELFGSIAFGIGWKATAHEDLSPGSLEVERPLRSTFAAFRHWRLMNAANKLGAHRGFGLRAGDLPARSAPHLCALTSTLPLESAALATGVAFQRVWLAAEALGLALQPMVASAILALHEDPAHGLRHAAFERLRTGWQDLVGNASPIIVFRMGRAARPAVRSGRRPVETYLR